MIDETLIEPYCQNLDEDLLFEPSIHSMDQMDTMYDAIDWNSSGILDEKMQMELAMNIFPTITPIIPEPECKNIVDRELMEMVDKTPLDPTNFLSMPTPNKSPIHSNFSDDGASSSTDTSNEYLHKKKTRPSQNIPVLESNLVSNKKVNDDSGSGSEEEAKILKRERNRLSACRYRERKRHQKNNVENQLSCFANDLSKKDIEIVRLKQHNEELLKQLDYFKNLHENQNRELKIKTEKATRGRKGSVVRTSLIAFAIFSFVFVCCPLSPLTGFTDADIIWSQKDGITPIVNFQGRTLQDHDLYDDLHDTANDIYYSTRDIFHTSSPSIEFLKQKGKKPHDNTIPSIDEFTKMHKTKNSLNNDNNYFTFSSIFTNYTTPASLMSRFLEAYLLLCIAIDSEKQRCREKGYSCVLVDSDNSDNETEKSL